MGSSYDYILIPMELQSQTSTSTKAKATHTLKIIDGYSHKAKSPVLMLRCQCLHKQPRVDPIGRWHVYAPSARREVQTPYLRWQHIHKNTHTHTKEPQTFMVVTTTKCFSSYTTNFIYYEVPMWVLFGFVFHLPQLLPVPFAKQTSCCISKSMM